MRGSMMRALRASGIDVMSAREAGCEGLTDEEQLEFASTQQRTIFTSNVDDFTRLSRNCFRVGRHHAGITVLTNQLTPVGRQIRALTSMTTSLSPEAMVDRVEFLGNWLD